MGRKKKKKKLLPLRELKFDSLGEEYIYLFGTLYPNGFSDKNEAETGKPTIENLRKSYNILLNSNEIHEKYSSDSIYWSEEQEKAIVEYLSEKDFGKKDIIFKNKLYKAFKKLIENIIFTYKLFRNDTEIIEVQADCMSFLITKLERFNPDNGTKAFGYFGTIAKHYLMNEKKIQYKMTKSNIDIDIGESDASKIHNYEMEHEEVKNVDKVNEIFLAIINAIEFEMNNPKMLPNDRKVGEAIVWIFKNHEQINVYNKNLVYHMLKERTGLETKDVTYSLSRFKIF